MRTIAILPIKSFGAAKQRLSSLLGSGSRQALAQAMFSDVLASLGHVPDLDGVAVVTANRVAQEAALRTGVTLLADTEEAGQSAAVQIGLRHALENGYERALLVPGDTPLLDPLEVAAMFDRSDEDTTTVTIVPDRHREGTNALLLDLPAAIEPAFGPGSLERHRAAAQAAGAAHRVDTVASLALDVDTPEDLAELRQTLDGRRGQAPMTRGALRQIDRSQVGATVGSGARVEA
jgi:2-phospho-L-lactate guanylyltransferase